MSYENCRNVSDILKWAHSPIKIAVIKWRQASYIWAGKHSYFAVNIGPFNMPWTLVLFCFDAYCSRINLMSTASAGFVLTLNALVSIERTIIKTRDTILKEADDTILKEADDTLVSMESDGF